MTTGGDRFLKVILVVFNVVFAIGGLISLISGGVALGAIRAGTSGLKMDDGDNSLTGASGLLIAIGIFVFITAVLGCVAAFREHRVALLVYSVILIFILILQFAAAIAAFALKGKLKTFIHHQLDTMQNSIANDTTTNLDKIGKAFKLFQTEWKCCGLDGPSDWLELPWFKTKYGEFGKKNNMNVTFPGCCYGDATVCKPCASGANATTVDCVAVAIKDSATALWSEGCSDGLTDYMRRNVGIVAGVALTFGLIQVLGIIVSCLLARSLGNSSGHERMN